MGGRGKQSAAWSTQRALGKLRLIVRLHLTLSQCFYHKSLLQLEYCIQPTLENSCNLPSCLILSHLIVVLSLQCSMPRSLWLGCSSLADSMPSLRCLYNPGTGALTAFQVLSLSLWVVGGAYVSNSLVCLSFFPVLYLRPPLLHYIACISHHSVFL